MRTEEAVTGAGGILFGYGALVATYLGLGAVTFWVLRRLSRVPLEEESTPNPPGGEKVHA
jgi:hypothetical protein